MKIALTFSGGGYRAAGFSLGTLSLLDKLNLENENLLKSVEILSTVSGGTITGLRYAAALKRGETFQQFYDEIYKFLADTTLIQDALAMLSDDDHWKDGRVRSLVAAFADVYHKKLFDYEKFGILMDETKPAGIKHVSFNATEFANANQFRFQWSEKIINPSPGEAERGVIGNFFYPFPENLAKDIRLADIMASSSCFPGGFEPINFPSDFVLPASTVAALPNSAAYPVGLMDGGIVDNQGIQPVLLASERIQHNYLQNGGDPVHNNQIDIVLISDVASPYMEDFKASKENRKGWWKNLTPRLIINTNYALLLLSIFAFGYFYFNNSLPGMLISTVLFSIAFVLYIVFNIIGKLIKGAGIPEQFLEPLSALKRTKLYVYQSLILNRINSLMMLTMEVFLKHVRRMNYTSIYADKGFLNRRIMSAIYELKSGTSALQSKVAKGTLPQNLLPTEEMQAIADRASSMATTLWFSPEEIKTDMLNTIIACGQFTTCWNLLEYIDQIKKDKTNTNENHDRFIALENDLLKIWDQFKQDPMHMTR